MSNPFKFGIVPNLITSIAINLATGTGDIIAAQKAPDGATPLVIRVYGIWLIPTGTTTIQFQDGSGSGAINLSGAAALLASQEFWKPLNWRIPWYVTSPGNAFHIVAGSSTQISGTAWYEIGGIQSTS